MKRNVYEFDWHKNVEGILELGMGSFVVKEICEFLRKLSKFCRFERNSSRFEMKSSTI